MEKFYIVTENSPIYQQYKDYRENRKIIREHVKKFFKKHGIEAHEFYADDRTIAIVPTQNDLDKFKKVLTMPSFNGLQYFKKNSKIGKDWIKSLKEEGLEVLHKPYLGFVFRVSGRSWTRLFDWKGVIYCSCECDCGEWPTPEGMEEIKASEFYKVLEEIEAFNKELIKNGE